MKVRQLFEKLQEDWAAKVICIAVAIFIYIFHNISTLDRKTFSVPLKVSANAGFLPCGDFPSHVKIVLRGEKEELAFLAEDDVSALLDLNGCLKNGDEQLPILIQVSERARLLNSIEYHVVPENITIKVEERFSAYSPVSPLIYGTPAHGYFVESVKVTPSTVKITGPRSMVENCTRLQTARVTIEGANVPLSQKVSVENAGDFLELSEVDFVTVEVKIAPEKGTKTFENIPVFAKNLSKNLKIQKMSECRVTLSGALLELEKYVPSPGDFSIDCSEIFEAGSYDFQVKSGLSEKFLVENLDSIIVDFSAIEIESEDQTLAPLALPEDFFSDKDE